MATKLNQAESDSRLTAPASAGTVAVTIDAPMIGRDHELQRLLQDLYGVIEQNESRLVTVVGPAGIGKSRLARELSQVVARLPDAVAVLSLQADRQSTAQPYSLLRLLVASLFRIREGDQPAVARTRIEQGVAAALGAESLERAHFIGQLAGYDFTDSPFLRSFLADPRQLRERAVSYAIQYLAALTAQTPLVLIVDDLHYADDSSLDVFVQAFAEGRHIGALVVCLAQQRLFERRADWGGRRIQLAPLDEHAGRRLVGEILRKAGKLPGDLRSMIVQRAEGNPFYVEELIKMLIADGVIVPGPSSWQIRQGRLSRLRIPNTLADLLRARLNALAPSEREFLLRAAVVGRFFWAESALQLSEISREHGGSDGGAALVGLLESLERKELVAQLPESRFPGQHEYAFRHELLHEVAYAQVPPDMRQVYHRMVAEWLIEYSDERVAAYAGLIAEHYQRGGRPRKAANWWVQAGAHARETYATEAALSHYHAALALLPDDPEAAPERLACYEGLGETQSAIARLGDAVASYSRMAELADLVGDASAAARAWNGLAYVFDYSLDYRSAEASARRALELAEAAEAPRQLVMALYHVAWAELRNERPAVALELGRRATALLAQIDDPAVNARCKSVIGIAYEQLGDYSAARQNLAEALGYNRAISDLTQIASLLNNLGYVANMQGDYQAALGFLQEGLRVAHESQARLNEIYILTNLAYTLNGLGDYVVAEAEARRGIGLCETSRITAYADFYCVLSEACLYQGRVTEAVESAQQALATAQATEGPREVAAACRALGLAISGMSDPQGARPCFEESARIFAETGAFGDQARTLRVWAAYELRSGDPVRGAQLYQQARSMFTELDLQHELERTPRSLPHVTA